MQLKNSSLLVLEWTIPSTEPILSQYSNYLPPENLKKNHKYDFPKFLRGRKSEHGLKIGSCTIIFLKILYSYLVVTSVKWNVRQ